MATFWFFSWRKVIWPVPLKTVSRKKTTSFLSFAELLDFVHLCGTSMQMEKGQTFLVTQGCQYSITLKDSYKFHNAESPHMPFINERK